MLIVKMPDSARRERDYVLSILLGRWLGIKFRTEFGTAPPGRVVISGPLGCVTQPDLFLPEAERDWCGRQTCPDASQYRLRKDLPDHWSRCLGDSDLPILFELKEQSLLSRVDASDGQRELRLSFDLLGTAFFFLSRYEEVVAAVERDEHDRFSAWSSCAGKAGLLDRPVVNEYLEILWLSLKEIDPGCKRKKRSFEVVPTHDVDRPFCYHGVSAKRMAKIGMGQLRAGRGLGSVLNLGRGWVKTRLTGAPDPYYTFPWILKTSEEQKISNTFYIQCTRSEYPEDDNYNHLDRRIISFVQEAARQGHRVGLHPGYGTYRNSRTLSAEMDRFRELWRISDCGELVEWRSRQHFLRWHQEITPGILNEAGIHFDSTLGFADSPGFRCGCCYDYPLYDLRNRKPLVIIEEPLILMECSIIDDRYLGLGAGKDALDLARKVWRKCRHFNGQFVFLWHNHRLVKDGERALYEAILGINGEKGPSV